MIPRIVRPFSFGPRNGLFCQRRLKWTLLRGETTAAWSGNAAVCLRFAACGVSTTSPTARSDYWDMNPAQAPKAVGFNPARLIETYQAGVWRYLRAMGCESALAEDLTQETFLAVLQRPFNDVSPAGTSAYLRKTALNMLISHQRRVGRVRAVENIEQLDQTWMRWAGDDDGELVLVHLRDCLG